MKKLVFFVLALPFCFFSLAHADKVKAGPYWEKDSRSPQFCLQNFNAYGPIYASNIEGRSELIAGFFQTLPRCDVIHLQEVWNEPQINIFENFLKGRYNISSPNRESKIGLMSLFLGDIKVRETRNFRVNSEGGVLDSVRSAFSVKKAYHVVRSSFEGFDEDFYFVNTHLHPSSVAVRITQILDLLYWRLQRQDVKLLLSGDFNADVDSLERKLVMFTLGVHDSMEDYFGGAYPHSYCTYCSGNPLGWLLSDHTFDYVFYSNVGATNTSLKVNQGSVNMRGTPRQPWSDHFGVRVVFSVEPGTSSPDRWAMQERRDGALNILRTARLELQKQRGEEYLPYVTFLRELEDQLRSSRGAFNHYFESFR